MKRTLISLLMTAAMLLSLLAGIPLRTSAAEQTEPAITLSIDGDRLNAQCAGLPANARIIAAGYDGSGQMKTVEVRTGKTPGFAYDRQYGYRVFAVDPDTSQPLCEATSRVELFSGQVTGIPYIGGTPDNGSAVAKAMKVASRQCLDARIALEEVLAAFKDPKKSQAQLDALLDNAMAAYKDMEEAGAVLWAVAEAQAEREKNARIILAEVEKNISEMMVDAAEPYVGNPEAMQLRSFNLMQDIARKGNNFVVVPNAVSNAIGLSAPAAKED